MKTENQQKMRIILQKLTITLYHIIERSLLATLGIHMAPSAGNIWKQPIFKMVTPFQICTKLETQSVIRLFNSEGIKPMKIIRECSLTHQASFHEIIYHHFRPLNRLTKRMLFPTR
jgi:hypothetical protein